MFIKSIVLLNLQVSVGANEVCVQVQSFVISVFGLAIVPIFVQHILDLQYL